MSSAGHDRPRASSDLSPLTLGLASVGSVIATVVVSRFGLAGTVAGAAVAPVVITMVRELGRRPVERVVRLPSGARTVVRRGPRVRPRTVALTAGVAFVVAVAAFTIPETISGSSVVSERPSTFFSPGDGDGGGGTTTSPERTTGEPEVAPATEGVESAPAPETTTGGAEPTTPDPTEAAPATAPDAVPGAPAAPAPAAPPPTAEPVPPPG